MTGIPTSSSTGTRRLLKSHQFKFATAGYDSVLNGACPAIASQTVVIFPFFPFVYWDRRIEPKTYKGMYGSRRFYSELKRFWQAVAGKLNQGYKGKTIHFVNSPRLLPTERDKQSTNRALTRAGIRSPRSYRVTDVPGLLAMLRKGANLFIKVRYGSMGKGITYLEEGKWRTNFGFRAGRITNRHSDYGWRFRDVTGNTAFLKELLAGDMVIEEAIPRWLVKDSHFDLRALVFYGKVLYMYPRCSAAENVTTNVSQGATSKTLSFLKGIDSPLIEKAERTSVKAARVLGLNFAGVDILLDPRTREPVVIEVNAFPGFPKMRTFNLARYLINEIGERKWK